MEGIRSLDINLLTFGELEQFEALKAAEASVKVLREAWLQTVAAIDWAERAEIGKEIGYQPEKPLDATESPDSE